MCLLTNNNLRSLYSGGVCLLTINTNYDLVSLHSYWTPSCRQISLFGLTESSNGNVNPQQTFLVKYESVSSVDTWREEAEQ